MVGWCQSTCFVRGSWWGQIKLRQATQKIKELFFIFFFIPNVCGWKWLAVFVVGENTVEEDKVENATHMRSFTYSIVYLTSMCTCMYVICKYSTLFTQCTWWPKEFLNVSTDAKSRQILEIDFISITLSYWYFNCNSLLTLACL